MTLSSRFLCRSLLPLTGALALLWPMQAQALFDDDEARKAVIELRQKFEAKSQATDAALAADLLAGCADLATPGLLARLRRMALAKLSADMPKYSALAAARAQWEGN